jgi:hypothetical protein
MLRFKTHYRNKYEYADNVGDRELKYDGANCQKYDPYPGNIRKLDDRERKMFYYDKRDVCNKQREEQLSRPFIKGCFKNGQDYACNVNEPEWDYDYVNFMTYAPSLNYATGGGIRDLNSLSDWKCFIYEYRDEYNKRWEEGTPGTLI